MNRVRILACTAALAAGIALAAGCGTDAFHCQVDHDCNGTDLCRVTTGECVPLSAAECRQDADCVDPRMACFDLSCVKRCTDEASCNDSTRTCADGRCVPRGVSLDAAG